MTTEEKKTTSDEKAVPSSEQAPSSFGAQLLDRAKKATGELKDASVGKMIEMLDDFNSALPVVRKAGYTLSSVDIGIGLPPKVSASFLASDDVSPEDVEQIMTDHAEKKFTLMLVKSLHQAWQLQKKIKIAGLQPRGLSVDIGLVPTVTVRFG